MTTTRPETEQRAAADAQDAGQTQDNPKIVPAHEATPASPSPATEPVRTVVLDASRTLPLDPDRLILDPDPERTLVLDPVARAPVTQSVRSKNGQAAAPDDKPAYTGLAQPLRKQEAGADQRTAPLTRPQETRIEELLAAARRDLALGALWQPAGHCAADRYRAILQVQPAHPEALAGAHHLANVLVEETQSALAAGNSLAAALVVRQIRSLQPHLPQLRELEQQLRPAGSSNVTDVFEPVATSCIDMGPGTRLLNGRFELQRRLGAGGAGVVYQALDLEAARLKDPNPRVAIKVPGDAIQSLPETRLALQREMSRTRRLTHPNIVRVYEFYEDHGVCFITMELLEGRSWATLVRERPDGMSLAAARPLIEQLCAALTYAHGQAMVHSDLKPENLFLTHAEQVKVLDFGIAAPLRRTSSSGAAADTLFNPRRMVVLSERYACPELWDRLDPDPRDDVYSVGCIIYELLSGAHPFDGASALQALREKRIPLAIKSLSRAQNGALRQALQLHRESRTPSVEALATQLWQSGSTLGMRRTHSVIADGRLPARRWITGALVACALVIAALLLLTLKGLGPTPTPADPNTVSPAAAQSLARRLGMVDTSLQSGASYTRVEVLAAVAGSPRRARLGSSSEQIAAAIAQCRETSGDCDGWYTDESPRNVVMRPFRIDHSPVTVAAFREFVAKTHYQTEPERAGGAYALSGGQLHFIPGGNWTNAVGTGAPAEQSAVVGVTYNDAVQFCRWRGERLPTEDEWEYAARGPRGSIFPWGDDPALARARAAERPAATDGPAEGVDGTLRGLSGNIWQWVDTTGAGGDGRKVLKGGSYLEQSPANRRAAVRRSERANRADSDSGFRCARSQEAWPDAPFWVNGLR